jgi:hypothetical protein
MYAKVETMASGNLKLAEAVPEGGQVSSGSAETNNSQEATK